MLVFDSEPLRSEWVASLTVATVKEIGHLRGNLLFYLHCCSLDLLGCGDLYLNS